MLLLGSVESLDGLLIHLEVGITPVHELVIQRTQVERLGHLAHVRVRLGTTESDLHTLLLVELLDVGPSLGPADAIEAVLRIGNTHQHADALVLLVADELNQDVVLVLGKRNLGSHD